MDETAYTLIGLFFVKCLYAYILECTQTNYKPLRVWFMAAGGVALVGIAITIRLLFLPLPLLESRALVRWCWEMGVWHMIIGGLPIIIWLIGRDRAQILEALEWRTNRKR